MSKRRQDSELIWLAPWAGYGPGETYAVIIPEYPYYFNHEYWEQHSRPAMTQQEWQKVATVLIAENNPCMLGCGEPDCSGMD